MPTETPKQDQAKAPSQRDAVKDVQDAHLGDQENEPTRGEDSELAQLAKDSPHTIESATDWFLDPEEDDETRYFEINVGLAKPKWVRWGVTAIQRERIKEIRKMTDGNRASRRSGGAEPDDMAQNLRIAVEGTVEPDLSREDVRRAPNGQPFPSKEDALQYRFRKKPGLIDQIAAEVLAASGYDDEDIREVTAAGG